MEQSPSWEAQLVKKFLSVMKIVAGRPGFESRQEQDFSLLHSVQTGSGACPASYQMGTRDDFLGGQEWWTYTFTPLYVFMA
jgi:hypothetical protein